MEQVNSQPPLSQPQVPPTPNQQLPHLVVEEPKRGIFGTLGVVIVSLALLGIPLGIFLVSQRTQVAPQAAETEKQPIEASSGIFMESKLSSGGEIPVNIYVKAPTDPVNLVNAQIKFDAAALSVEKIVTSSADMNSPALFNKWIEADFDNTQGKISLIAGLPTPGLKTGSPNDEQIHLATLHLKSKTTGSSVLQVTPQSQVLRNSDNQNLFQTGNDLVLNLTSVTIESTPTPSPAKTSEALIIITNPVLATNYSYFKTVDIIWSAFNVESISKINLYMNHELVGPITENIEAKEGKYEWKPQESLSLPNIQPTNIFQIEIVGSSKNGEVAKVISAPFGILGVQEVSGTPPNPGTFGQNQLEVKDISRALTNYLVSPLADKSLDLNKDDLINDLDLFLMRQNMLLRGVLK